MPGDQAGAAAVVKCQVKKQLKPRADMGKEKGNQAGSEQPTDAHNTWSQLPPSLGLLSVKPEQKAYSFKELVGPAPWGCDSISFSCYPFQVGALLILVLTDGELRTSPTAQPESRLSGSIHLLQARLPMGMRVWGCH